MFIIFDITYEISHFSNIKAFSCSRSSMFQLNSKECKKENIFPNLTPDAPPDKVKWKSVTSCISKACLIPAKGIQIVSKTCNEYVNGNVNKLNTTFSRNTDESCFEGERYLQLCSSKNNQDKCSKLITPSQFASKKCSLYQVHFEISLQFVWSWYNLTYCFNVKYIINSCYDFYD